jgi:hypothetical protein
VSSGEKKGGAATAEVMVAVVKRVPRVVESGEIKTRG